MWYFLFLLYKVYLYLNWIPQILYILFKSMDVYKGHLHMGSSFHKGCGV